MGQVGADRPDPLLRLEATTDAIAGLRDVLDAEEPLSEALDRVAVTAKAAIPDVDAVTITVLSPEGPHTIAYTDQQVAQVDERQYRAGRGPYLAAASARRHVRAVVGEHRDDWPEFNEAAQEAGIRTYLSLPLLLDDQDGEGEHVGSLNVYSLSAAAFDPFDEGLMRVVTVSAERAVANARRWQRARETVAQLETALTSRAEIDQAKGILMAVHGCTADEAFAKLAEESQRRNVKLNKVAGDFLEAARRKAGRQGSPGG